MGVVLTDAAARGEGLVGAEGGVRAAGLIGHQHQDACHQALQVGQGGLLWQAGLREIPQGRGRTGEGSGPQVAQGGDGRVLFILRGVVADLHLAMGADQDPLVGGLQAQHVQYVAVTVRGAGGLPRQLQLPGEDLLAGGAVGGQAQVLGAAAHHVGIVVAGLVIDDESHNTSR